jgi:hypothetical protein
VSFPSFASAFILNHVIKIKPLIVKLITIRDMVVTGGYVNDLPKNMIYTERINENTNDGNNTDVKIDLIYVCR